MSSGKVTSWIGVVVSVLISGLFVMSVTMKLMRNEEALKGMTQLGIPDKMMLPLAILELSCVVIYLIPATAVLGAILLTGYVGGAICAHWRADDVLKNILTPAVVGVVVWIGVCLREGRLRAVLPFRRQ